MSAQMTLSQKMDGLEVLKQLLSIKREDVIATQEEARRQIQLTQEEQGKVAEARAYIAKYNDLAAALEQRATAVGESKKTLDKEIEDFTGKVVLENTRLIEWEKQLKSVTEQQAATDKTHKDTAGALDRRSQEIDSNHANWQAAYDKRVEAVTAKEVAQKQENERLAEIAKKLKAKAARLAAEAQADE